MKSKRRLKSQKINQQKRALHARGFRWFVVGNIAAHTGHIVEFHMDDMYDYFYQDAKGSHGTALGEYATMEEAKQCLASFLQCDSVERGTYCYNHNPNPR